MILFGRQCLLLALSLFFAVHSRPAVTNSPRNMERFIQAVKQVEDSNPGLSPLALVRALRRTAGHDNEMTIHFLGSSYNLSVDEVLDTAILNTSSFSFFDKAIHHIVTNSGEERGVVLTPDGTTVALSPLLLGIESGLKARMDGAPPAGIFPLTLGRRLGLSFLSLQDIPPSYRLGPDGCWDNVEHPRVFKLSQPATLVTDAIINGGMDGLILGMGLSNNSSDHQALNCPSIIPRCQWGAEAHRGTPMPLSLPLPFLYVHHTYEPSSPCLSFPNCSHDMRSMQRFHQDDRGWNDIGYSFVVGSDGYIYEGRGWNTLGSHTRGHNSLGYGVSIIGNYTATLPSRHAMDLLRHRLVRCAIGRGGLTPNFTIHGHRQVVNTSCPGDAFFSEIQSWEHFSD
ncbi:N-acetylmuramoyl-L-alanine amidase [Takifugu flavidus]|uniref:N-acetylmuramoyl-L-alanine amidase n=1 Tax=Takifugu flavidus TaxID=433684 RepID=A0A5C6MW17_9TELE|nr:N-acetylmuramoyl-L-alanine amidase [Takifugu flavidus]